ncbi:GNAT family N-acetyltransferase [Couchioplanes caeruleus]|uniref:GNAT family N-acetyltransferase n=1 Tax=Couchioplanes caeruleus TaxID=56438 RepID=UPI00201B998D|nr:GNAT family N-acetyltransferase [Couchioplanes caeruleus]UQU66412.1 GNAT family N-acetyltransferase [Couchioplanes caeruleus]
MHPQPRDEIRVASFRDLDNTTLYAILKLRVDVFVVEQKCPYPELDGRDAEPGTRHVWLQRGDDVLACLRILDDGGGTERIGRVVTAPAARQGGHASRLMEHALTVVGNRPAVLGAQAHLAGFYARFGFQIAGERYVEDGIPHVPMKRSGPLSSAPS